MFREVWVTAAHINDLAVGYNSPGTDTTANVGYKRCVVLNMVHNTHLVRRCGWGRSPNFLQTYKSKKTWEGCLSTTNTHTVNTALHNVEKTAVQPHCGLDRVHVVSVCLDGGWRWVTGWQGVYVCEVYCFVVVDVVFQGCRLKNRTGTKLYFESFLWVTCQNKLCNREKVSYFTQTEKSLQRWDYSRNIYSWCRTQQQRKGVDDGWPGVYNPRCLYVQQTVEFVLR